MEAGPLDNKQRRHGASDCLSRLKAAEEALADVREVLLQMNQQSEDAVVLPVNPAARDRQVLDAGGKSKPQLPNPAAGHPLLTDMMARGGHHSFTCRPELDDIGGATAVAEKLGIDVEDAKRCHRAFVGCDVENRGKVKAAALNILLKEACGMQLSSNEIESVMQKYDLDSTGDLNFQEFLQLYCETPLFKATDLDHHITSVSHSIRQEMEDQRLTPGERAQGLGVSAKAVTSFLRKELSEASACLQMPVAGLLLCSFVMSVFLHMRVEELHAVDTAITWDLYENANFAWSGEIPLENGRMGHKNIIDVNSFADFWSWFNLGVVPLFWPEGWDVSEVRANMGARCSGESDAFSAFGYNSSALADMPNHAMWGSTCPENSDPVRLHSERWGASRNASHYLYYHTIVGGMRMRQETAIGQACPAPDIDIQKSVHAAKCLKSTRFWLEPELRQVLHNEEQVRAVRRGDGAEVQYLLSRTPQAKVRERLRELENQVWLNPTTAKLELMYTTYNAHMDLLTSTYIFFFINRAGHIHKIVEPVSVWLHPYHGWWNYVVDVIWFVIVTFILFTESLEVFRHVRQLGFLRGLRIYIKLSNVVDWMSVCYSYVIVYYWFEHLSLLASLRTLLRRGDAGVVGTWADEKDRQDFFVLVAETMDRTYLLRAVLAWYPFVIVSRLFKAFAAQPRLALVTSTITEASVDILHFAVVFGSIFIVYGTSAMILFGQELLEFANMGRAISTSFRILLGDYDWQTMNRVGRLRANVWFWTFIWLVQLTMLNMLLAIVMDVYTEVKGSMGTSSETLWSQAAEIWHRLQEVRAGRQMYLSSVLKALDATDLDEDDEDEDGSMALQFFNVNSLCAAVPGLQAEQAQFILIAAQELFEESNRSSTSLTDTALTVQKMSELLWKLHAAVQQLFHVNKLNASLIFNSSLAAGQMVRMEGDVKKEEKEDRGASQPNDALDMNPMLQTMSSCLKDFQQQHKQTEHLLSQFEQLVRSSQQQRPWQELMAEPRRSAFQRSSPGVGDREVSRGFSSICTSPRMANKV